MLVCCDPLSDSSWEDSSDEGHIIWIKCGISKIILQLHPDKVLRLVVILILEYPKVQSIGTPIDLSPLHFHMS